MQSDVPLLARQASAGLAAWYDGLLMLMNYHGITHKALDHFYYFLYATGPLLADIDPEDDPTI